MTDASPWITPDWMREASRSERLLALSYALGAMAAEIRSREQSHVARYGGEWDAGEAHRYRALQSAIALVDGLYAGARGVAIEVAAANKKAGREYHRMPIWVQTLCDVVAASWELPLPTSNEVKHDAGMESVA